MHAHAIARCIIVRITSDVLKFGLISLRVARYSRIMPSKNLAPFARFRPIREASESRRVCPYTYKASTIVKYKYLPPIAAGV
jgi:hypothetical protein